MNACIDTLCVGRTCRENFVSQVKEKWEVDKCLRRKTPPFSGEVIYFYEAICEKGSKLNDKELKALLSRDWKTIKDFETLRLIQERFEHLGLLCSGAYTDNDEESPKEEKQPSTLSFDIDPEIVQQLNARYDNRKGYEYPIFVLKK
ncbi:pantothenate kinase [Acrasis kona]|uniref:Pantothenate kinase n=1 Tax=Acrasis kona TaxID=1008807 RepID=A0AAW2Z842_9EUKA